MAQNIHALVSGNCSLLAQRKDVRNFHRMMQETPATLLLWRVPGARSRQLPN
jgi:hypothetical protein